MLAWPLLIEPDSVPWQESLLGSLPAVLLFLLLSRWVRSDLGRGISLLLLTVLAVYFNCTLFAQSFGSTWTNGEIIRELLLAHLHLLALALLPGALILLALRAIPRRTVPSLQG